ncbi:MAG: tyrosine-type recombinase/integrase [Pelagimonas sp.]|nr:tyrosine-type recombinase/integrase [Pelagimonas sp.]
MTRSALPKYVYSDRGYLRFIRRSRGQSVMMKEAFGSAEFWEHYNRLVNGAPAVSSGRRTFENLILSYYKSKKFEKLKPRTKQDYRTYIGHIREIWGEKDPAKIETKHIYGLQQANADKWRRANYLVQVMVVLMNHARLIGFLPRDQSNPAHGIPLLEQAGDGWEPWPDELREEFEQKATPRARLLYELSIGLGQRIGDTRKIRWSDIQDGAWDFNQGKTDKPLWIPLTTRLQDFLSEVPKAGSTVLTNRSGGPASYRSLAGEMRDVKAGLEFDRAQEYVIHGLRKNATIELYLAGCDDEMVKAVTGHSGVEMLKKYGGQVRQRELARRAQSARNSKEQDGTET